MVNPGSFGASRKAFLVSQKPDYSAGVVGGYAADALAVIQRKYLKRFPINLAHDEEPSEDSLAAVDDEEPFPEQVAPDIDVLSEEEYANALETLARTRKLLDFRKAIKRWLAYQHMKDQDMDPGDSGAHNPYRTLLHKLTGTTIKKPRQKHPANIWRKTQRKEIDLAAKQLENIPRSQAAAVRDKLARSMFEQLPEEEKAQWMEQAKEEHETAMARWKEDTDGKPSTLPEDRQKCIQGLVRFTQPILDLICEATGWKCTFIAGGPEPAHGGRLNIISVHSGVTTGDIKMNFGRAERLRYKKHVVPVYGSFLQKCYSPDECRSRALALEEGFEGLETMDFEGDGANFDSYDITKSSTHAEPAQPNARISRGEDIEMNSGDTAASPPRSQSVSPVPSHTSSPDPFHSPPSSRPISPVPSRPVSPTPSRPVSPAPVSPIDPGFSAPITPSHTRANKRPGDGLPARTSKRIRSSSEDASTPIRRSTRFSMVSAQPPPEPTSEPPSRPSRTRTTNASSILPASQRPAAQSGRPATNGRRALENHTGTSPSTGLSASSLVKTKPNWFSTSLQMLQTNAPPLGDRWAELLRLWAIFEEKEGFKPRKKLEKEGRPEFISEWLQRARSSTWRPEIGNIPALEKAFLAWWKRLQPRWRISGNGSVILDEVDGDWDALRKPGQNGILIVIVCLFYWGCEVQENRKNCMGWASALEDCILVLGKLI